MTGKDVTIATYVLEDSTSGPLVKDAIGGIRAATACEIEQYKINRRLREENEALRLDAARYRWLCKGSKTVDELLAFVIMNADPDAKIDAALAASSTERADESLKGEEG
jgi:hypothetical protein